jgi:hypothetical protein
MYFQEPAEDVAVVVPSILTRIAIGAAVVTTVVFGVTPQVLLSAIDGLGVFLH